MLLLQTSYLKAREFIVLLFQPRPSWLPVTVTHSALPPADTPSPSPFRICSYLPQDHSLSSQIALPLFPLMWFPATWYVSMVLRESWLGHSYLFRMTSGSPCQHPVHGACTESTPSSEICTLNHVPSHSLAVALWPVSLRGPTTLTTFWRYLFLTQPPLGANHFNTSLASSLEFLTFLIF